jgi:glycine/D-amino acid oxidase-like deaminating enzyme/nitrite reductase/ring-hydroxylating ferredoxin subunit
MSAIWSLGSLGEHRYPQLRDRVEVDTVIIGAGITGLTAALKLVEAGQRVAVVEALEVGAGTTGGSTGNLYGTLSESLTKVRKKWNDDVLNEVVSIRSAAVDFIEETVERFGIDCDFARRPLHFCVSKPNQQLEEMLDAELEASRVAGLTANLVTEVPELPFPVHKALRIENQAQFNPLAYAQALSKVVAELGGMIFEASPVTEIDASAGQVKTALGHVKATTIVEATHTPKGVNLVQAEMEPYEEYGVAARMGASAADKLPKGVFWILDDAQSLRAYSHGGNDYVVAVGEKHKTGHAEPGKTFYHNLSNYLKTHFAVAGSDYQWTAQQFKSADLLPYIGRSGHDNVFIGTGYGADGLTWGTVAGGIIGHEILGQYVRGTDLFSPRRFTPGKSAAGWMKENVSVTQHFVKDYLSSSDLEDVDAVAPGEGQVLKLKGEEVAVYRSADNQLSVLSPVCPHMKCKVKWNSTASTWDCPCHGSRFAPEGQVLEGPALQSLAPRPLRD